MSSKKTTLLFLSCSPLHTRKICKIETWHKKWVIVVENDEFVYFYFLKIIDYFTYSQFYADSIGALPQENVCNK